MKLLEISLPATICCFFYIFKVLNIVCIYHVTKKHRIKKKEKMNDIERIARNLTYRETNARKMKDALDIQYA